ncbi:hypothetical protein SAMN06265222_12135 [Neorhodopirellula lusitana]|uniref:Uncharacterized protein n=1 Tax=Neorhodopirellula lusitana TaxID=445327 RepID=A0ABY1QNQ4_9BACT|nr:hypothetical protein SAMN06265222_12135 [Neorhodopirellula lusitana]
MRQEPIYVETFGVNASIEGFDKSVIRRFSGPTEFERHAIGMRPRIPNFRCELGTVVDTDRLRQFSIASQTIQNGDDIASADRTR